MKDNFIHLVFVVDKSGSMYNAVDDVVGGFNRVVEEQKAVKEGKCAVTLYTFDDTVKEVYLGKDVNEIGDFEYHVGGCTAMNDGIGTAIDNVGKWLASMPEDERPSKNLVVIMTDGEENSSMEYPLEKVKEMIKHQQDKYNWTFMFLGADITTLNGARELGIRMSTVTSKKNLGNSYDMLSQGSMLYRTTCDASAASTMDCYFVETTAKMSDEYEKEKGIKL
jgi:uncharacterized protein YegL